MCAWIWVSSTHALLLWIYYQPQIKIPLGDEGTYWQVAQRIAAGQPSELPLLWPPLYPHFLAGCIGIANALGGEPLWWVQAFQLALLAAAATIARDLCIRLIGIAADGERVGNWTALGVIGFPPLIAFAHYARPEILHLGAFSIALWILAARGNSTLWAAAFGAVMGMALLTKSLLGPFVPVLLAPYALRGAPRDRVIRTSVAIAVLATAIAPTMLDNARQSGSFSIAGSSWFNLWVGLNDSSRRNLRQPVVGREFRIFENSAATFEQRNQILRDKIWRRVQERGAWTLAREQLSRQYFRLFDAGSYLTDQLPGGLIAARGGGYADAPDWAAVWIRSTSFALYAAVLVGSVAGVALCPPAGRQWMWIVLAFLAYNLAIFFVLHVKSRFRVQFLPFLFFYCACALNVWQSRGETHRRPIARWRLRVAAAAAGVLIFLAFASPLLDA
jgi:4-amino-4-deoxy-L-arabinose transferase-like glycosyltransferase